jgi:hypothetical protein
LDGGQFIHRFWVRQQRGTISFWLSLKKSPLFELFFSNPFYKPTNPILQTYQPHSRACNPSSPSYIFCGPNTLVSRVSRSNAHSSIFNIVAHSSVSSIVPSPSLVVMWVPSHHHHRLCLKVHSAPYPLLLVFSFSFTLHGAIEDDNEQSLVVIFLFVLPRYKRQRQVVVLFVDVFYALLKRFWYAILSSF